MGCHGDTFRVLWLIFGSHAHMITGKIAQFLASANFHYLRRCAGVDCVIYFYDTTKSHRRQWRRMPICGNRHKAAKFRAKNGEK